MTEEDMGGKVPSKFSSSLLPLVLSTNLKYYTAGMVLPMMKSSPANFSTLLTYVSEWCCHEPRSPLPTGLLNTIAISKKNLR